MALDRWIALVFLLLCLVYGYSAFFVMDAGLPPFMRRNPVWPSTFPKILAVCGALVSLVVLLGFEKGAGEPKQERSITGGWRSMTSAGRSPYCC